MPDRPRRIGLRSRIVIAFALSALVLSALLALITFSLTRDNLIDAREEGALDGVVFNARQVSRRVSDPSDATQITEVISGLSTRGGSVPMVRFGEFRQSVDPVEFSFDDIDRDLLRQVEAGEPGQMRYRLRDTPYLVVGIPLVAQGGVYFEATSLEDIESTLSSLGLALLGSGVVTTMAGIALGFWAARRLLLPLGDIGEAAEAIASGQLDTRLETEEDRDLGKLAASFNRMSEALQERIERDARFASEVSHELRSPLMTLTASVEVLRTRRDELPERSRTALDLLTSDVERFQQLVEDLLEISRFDAGAASLELSEFDVCEFLRQALAASGHLEVPLVYDPGIEPLVIEADKRRLARVMANLIDNADKYGGGIDRVTVDSNGEGVEIGVEDCGPGVPIDERQLVFDRFSRGSEGGRRGSGTGVGLGLALVAEHLQLHGGDVSAGDRSDGLPGARFAVSLPRDRS